MGKKPIKVLQLNAGKGREATNLLHRTAEVVNADVVVIQEMYRYMADWPGWQKFAHDKTATLVRECFDAVLLRQHTGEAVMTVAVKDTMIANVYVEPTAPIDRPLNKIQELVRAVGNKTVIICGDLNAKGAAWGGDITDERGSKTLDLIGTEGLVIENDPNSMPTFETVNGRSWVDVTFSANAEVTRWTVHEEDSLSDHRLLSFSVGNDSEAEKSEEKRFLVSRADWDKFADCCRQAIPALRIESLEAERAAESLQEAAMRACRAAIPRGKVKRQRTNPWWNDHLQRLKRETRHAREAAQAARQAETREALFGIFREKRRAFKTAIKTAKVDSLRRLLGEGDPRDPWGVAHKILSAGKRKKVMWETVQRDNGGGWTEDRLSTITVLIEKYFPVDDPLTDTEGNREDRDRRIVWNERLQEPDFSDEEIERVIAKRPKRKAPGLDGFPSAGLLPLLGAAGEELRQVLNKCLRNGIFPRVWKGAQIAWLPKPGGTGLRPICLLPTIGKVLDKLLADRLSHFLETNSKLSPGQFGFRKGKSAVDAIERVTDVLKRAKADRKHALVVALDIKNAFNSAWYPRLKKLIAETGCPADLGKTIANFLSDRTITSEGVMAETQMGCPQGSCLGPILWLLIMEEWFAAMQRVQAAPGTEVYAQAYADDQLIIIVGRWRVKLEETWQKVWKACEAWAAANKLRYAPEKTTAMCVGAKVLRRQPVVRLGDTIVQTTDIVKYLGVVIDRGMLWIEHANYVRGKIAAAGHRVRTVAGKTWGTRPEVLREIYKGAIRPALLYASEIWGERAGDSRMVRHLAAAQRPFLLGITKAYRTTSNAAIQTLSGCMPLHLEAKAQHEKRTRLKSENYEGTVAPGDLPHPAVPRRSWQLATANEVVNGAWIFTDASTEAEKCGIAGVAWKNGRIVNQWKRRAAKYVPTHRAELWAIGIAVEMALSTNERVVNIASDSKTALNMVAAFSGNAAWSVSRIIDRAADRDIEIKLWWAPGEMEGIKSADRLANKARIDEASTPEIVVSDSRGMAARTAKRNACLQWQQEWDNGRKGRVTHEYVPRVEERRKDWTHKAVCLLTGHGPFKAYLKRFRLAAGDGLCECDLREPETADHIANRCTVQARVAARERFAREQRAVGGTEPFLVHHNTKQEEVDNFNRLADKVVPDRFGGPRRAR